MHFNHTSLENQTSLHNFHKNRSTVSKWRHIHTVLSLQEDIFMTGNEAIIPSTEEYISNMSLNAKQIMSGVFICRSNKKNIKKQALLILSIPPKSYLTAKHSVKRISLCWSIHNKHKSLETTLVLRNEKECWYSPYINPRNSVIHTLTFLVYS
jgi:hypothetical protein